ncbi:MAG TPA: flotillin domain-containing protein, partial [Candidatus Dormibacteraeota bacterium]|nr:flotillin domain-containing protein [Candidatus Dormibacteraeota bacterium]
QQVQDAAKGDLATSGLQIDAFTIQSFSDESNYIELLGKQSVATVTRDARMAQASTDQEAAVREAQAQQVKINAARDVSLREAETKTQVTAAQARADQAGPLAMAEAQQEVVRKQTELAQLEADRKEKELLSTTVKPAAADAQAVIARAEGAKRARIASAEADAETTRLEGGAEAQIVLTKGEAEAKALAMRADAYKQFNEAAIIQTVLAALPDIVRAAAEPMGHIDSLTVMSADGASDIVRNATRAMIESTTAIKGLTGLDVPNLVGGALGRGFGDRLRTGEGSSEADTKSTVDRISQIAGEGLATMKSRISEAEARAKAEADEAKAEAAAKAEADAEKVKQAAEKAGAVIESKVESKVAAAVAKVAPSDGNLQQWAKWLADQLRRVPDIQVYDALRLADLETRGPAAARGVWLTAKEALAKEYGKVTVGDLLNRFGK